MSSTIYHNFDNTPIRFFIADLDMMQEPDTCLDYFVEVNEYDFVQCKGEIEYERFTVRENGVSQICLTKRNDLM